jgi:hypothetical protein
METFREVEDRICRAIAQLDDVKRIPGFEDVDVDRLRAVLEQILANVRAMSLN